MKDNPIRDSLLKIEPPEGAQQRMYRHIMEKSARPQPSGPRALRMILPLAACLLLVLGLTATWRNSQFHPTAPHRNVVSMGSPVIPVSGPEALSSSGIDVEVPEEAENITCFLMYGEIAKVQFTLNEIPYVLLASGVRTDDFSGVTDGSDLEPVPEYSGSFLSRSQDGIWKAVWNQGGVKCYLLNDAGADREDMIALMKEFRIRKLD